MQGQGSSSGAMSQNDEHLLKDEIQENPTSYEPPIIEKNDISVQRYSINDESGMNKDSIGNR